jgi:hypothetical protein
MHSLFFKVYFFLWQGFKECCAPLEAVVGFISHYLCGREVIPDVVHRRTSDEPSAKKQPGNNNHETDSNDGADGSESNQKANGHQKRQAVHFLLRPVS